MNLLRPPALASCLVALALSPGLRAEDPPASDASSASTAPATPATPASASPAPNPDDGLRFNFRGAPLEQVLNYLSDAAGFIIVLDAPVRGTVDMFSRQPVSKLEAVGLLNHALNKNGYTATLQGRNLIIASKETAKKQNIPVRTGNDPREIPPTADMVMQIIPLRNIGAAQAARDIATLIPDSATITANEDSNSLVVTDTQINVRHIVEVVAQIDGSISADAGTRIFQLKNADPLEMADLINTLYGTATSGNRGGNTANAGGAFAGGPGGAAAAFLNRMAGGGGNAGGGNGGNRARGGAATSSSRAVTPVSATADARTGSLIVSASHDTLRDIADIVTQLDQSGAKKQKVYVYTLENASVQQVEAVLKNLFQSSNSRNTTSTSQTDALSARAQSNTQQTSGSFLNSTSQR